MTVPLVVLGAGALLAGYVWVGIAHFEPWVTWLEPALGSIHAEHAPGTPLIAMAFGMSAAAVGIGLAYLWYFRSSTVPALLASRFRGLHQLLLDKWRIDELYDNTILAASRGIAWLCARFDSVVVDGLTTKVTVQLVVGTSWLFTRIQTGLVHTYGAVMAVGLLAVVFHFMVPHAGPEMVGEPVGMKVSFSANRGLGYQYRWDYDGDGEFDSEWTTDAASEHEFRDAELKGFAVVVESAAYAAQPRTFIVKAGEQLHVRTGALSKVVSRGELGVDEFGDGWRLSHNDKNAGLPTIVGDEHGIVIKPHGAKVRKAGRLEAPDADVHVARGEHVTIGEARVSVSGMAKPKLSVRNAFGMESAETLSIVLPKVTPRISAQVASAARSAGPMTADVVTAKGVTP